MIRFVKISDNVKNQIEFTSNKTGIPFENILGVYLTAYVYLENEDAALNEMSLWYFEAMEDGRSESFESQLQ